MGRSVGASLKDDFRSKFFWFFFYLAIVYVKQQCPIKLVLETGRNTKVFFITNVLGLVLATG